MTKELRTILKVINIPTVSMVGDNKDGKTRHMWVGIPFMESYIHLDATNLMFFDPSIEFRNIHIK